MSRKPVVLAVDQDSTARTFVYQTLTVLDIEVQAAADLKEFDVLRRKRMADLYLVDLDLPNDGGRALAHELRRSSAAPVVFLGRHSDPDRHLQALETGAIDCLGKPFHPREFTLRITNILACLGVGQGHERREGLERPAAGDTVRRFGDWTFDLLCRCLIDTNGSHHVLTAAEFEVLALLTAAAQRTVTRDEVVQRLGAQSAARHNARIVDVLVWRLRKKLGDHPSARRYIATVPSRGYVFVHAVSTR